MSTSATRVVLADDDVLLREGLASLLERSGFEVVGQGGTAGELLAIVRDLGVRTVVTLGALLSVIAFGSLLYGIIEGPEKGWGTIHSAARDSPRCAR